MVLQNKLKINNYFDILGILVFITATLLVFFYLVPRKGVSFGDEGWYLYNAWIAADQLEFDKILPQAPAYLINSVLIKLGLNNYLYFRWVYYLILSIALFFLLYSFKPKSHFYLILGFGLSYSLLTPFSAIVNYHSTPVSLFLLSVSMLYFSIDNVNKSKFHVLPVLTGFFFALTLLSNALLFLVASLSFFCIYFCSDQSGKKEVIKAGLYTLLFASLFYLIYLNLIGINNFLANPPAHSLKGLNIFRLTKAFRFVLEWATISGVLIFLSWFLVKYIFTEDSQRENVVNIITVFSMLMCSLYVFLAYINKQDWFELAWLLNPAHHFFMKIKFFTIGSVINMHPATQIGVLGLANFVLVSFRALFNVRRYMKPIITGWLLVFLYLSQMYFSLMNIEMVSVFISGPLMALSLYILTDILSNESSFRINAKNSLKILVVPLAMLLTPLAYGFSYHHPGVVNVFGEKIGFEDRRLKGILEAPERANTINWIIKTSKQYSCKDKYVLTLATTSLVYYLIEARAPKGLEYIWPRFNYEHEKTIMSLEASENWCVYISRNYENDYGWKNIEPLLIFLENESEHIILSPKTDKSHIFNDFVLYLKENNS